MALRDKHQNLLAFAGVIALSALLGFLLPRYVPFLHVVENWAYDVRLDYMLQPAPLHDEIVIVTITEETLAQLPYREPLDRGLLADVLVTLDKAEVKAIGIDLLLDQPTTEENDQRLHEVLHNLSAPVVMSWANAEDGLTERQVAFMDEFLRGVGRGYADLHKDPRDLKVRYVTPGRTVDGQLHLGLPGAIAETVGITPTKDLIRLDYRGRPEGKTTAFARYPAHTLAVIPEPIRNRWFGGKIVLIGADLSLVDRHRTPLGKLPGVIIHAHALAQIIDGRELRETGPVGEILLGIATALIGVALVGLQLGILGQLATGVLFIGLFWAGGFLLYSYSGFSIALLTPSISCVLAIWLGDVYAGRSERRQKKFLQAAFSRYVSPAVVNQLIGDPASLTLVGERRRMTFLFTDIADFTTLTEKTDPATLLPLLNQYLEGLVRTVFEHGGTIDKFIGDAVFAIFNAPLDQPDHEARAVDCALAIDRFAQAHAREQAAHGVILGVTRIGVHTGEATVGNFGGEHHFDYTALGDAVNTASRMEGVNKSFGTRICVSEATAERCPHLRFRPIGDLVLKGKRQAVRTLEPLVSDRADSHLTARYTAAFDLFRAGCPEARAAFELGKLSDAGADVAMELLQNSGDDAIQAFERLKRDDPDAGTEREELLGKLKTAFRQLEAANPTDGLTAFHASRINRGETSSLIVLTSK